MLAPVILISASLVSRGWQITPVELDYRGLAWLQVAQRGALSRKQALQSGITANAIEHRLRRGGPWQRLPPGVYLPKGTGQPAACAGTAT
jgi:hypothetical protein